MSDHLPHLGRVPEPSDGFQDFHDPASDHHASYSAHPMDSMEPVETLFNEDFTRALQAIFQWLTAPHVRHCHGLKVGGKAAPGRRVVETVCPRKLGMRTAALIYSLRPDLFPGETSVSLSRKIKVTKAAFSKHVRAFREDFGLQTRTMRSVAAREAMRRGAFAGHAKRKQKP